MPLAVIAVLLLMQEGFRMNPVSLLGRVLPYTGSVMHP